MPRTASAGSWGPRWRGPGRTGISRCGCRICRSWWCCCPPRWWGAGGTSTGCAGERGGGCGGRAAGLQAAAAAVPGDDLRLHRGLDGLQLEREVSEGRAGQFGAGGDRSVQRLHGDVPARAGDRGPGGAAVRGRGRRAAGGGGGRGGVRRGGRGAGAGVGMLGFTLLGLGLCVLVPQTFAAAGRLFPGASDTAIARLNVFNYVGFLIGSPLVGALGDAWSYRGRCSCRWCWCW